MWYRLRRVWGGARSGVARGVVAVWAVMALGIGARAADGGLRELKAALEARDGARTQAAIQGIVAGAAGEEELLAAGAMLAEGDGMEDAARVFGECVRRYPGSFRARYNLALARIGLGDDAGAQRAVDGMEGRDADERAGRAYLQGKIRAAEGRLQEARASLESAWRAKPEEENYALELALVEIRAGEYVPAIAVLEAALKRNEGAAELELELALADALAGRQGEAVAECRRLLERAPDLGAARVIQAFASCMRADYAGCEAAARAGLKLEHPAPYLFYLDAEAKWNSGSAETVAIREELDKAVAAMPECAACLMLRSKALEKEGEIGAAIADLKKALDVDGEMAPAWYRLGVLYRKAGRSGEAEEAMRRYRAVEQRQVDGEIESFRRALVGSRETAKARGTEGEAR